MLPALIESSTFVQNEPTCIVQAATRLPNPIDSALDSTLESLSSNESASNKISQQRSKPWLFG
jgi:hypothetical protein